MLHLLNQLFPSIKLMFTINFDQMGGGTGRVDTSNDDKSKKLLETLKDISVAPKELKEKIMKETQKDVEALNQEMKLNERIKKCGDKTLLLALTKPVNKNSPKSQREAAQRALVALNYNLSFISTKTGEKVEGEAAIDGILGNTFKNAIKIMQKDLGIDPQNGHLGPITSKAFKELLSTKEVKEKQTTGDNPTAEILSKTTTKEEVVEQIDTTRESVDNFRKSLILTDILNKNLSNYLYEKNEGKSILHFLQGDDEYGELVKDGFFDDVGGEDGKKFEERLEDEKNKQKLDNAVRFLVGNSEVQKLTEGEDIETSQILENATKILPWFVGAYICDIPLSFIQKIVPGADVNKSIAFQDWIKEGMNEEFEEYYEKYEKKDINVLKNQYSLRSKLSSLKIEGKDGKKLVLGELKELDVDTKDLIRDYIAYRLVPDLNILHGGSFNSFERGDWYTLWGLFGVFTDIDADKSINLITKLEKEDFTGKSAFQIANEVLDILKDEGDISTDNLRDNVDYMEELEAQNELHNRMAELIESGHGYLKILYKFEKVEDIKSLGVSNDDIFAIDQLSMILSKNPISEEALNLFEKSYPSVVEFIKAIGNPEAMKKYLISTIPQDKILEYTNVGTAKHGEKLTGDNEADFKMATEKTPKKDSKMSVLGFAFNSFVEKAGLLGITYPEFEAAFKNKEKADISDIDGKLIINTGKEDNKEFLTDIENLNSTEVYKSKVEKKYSYYTKDGELIKADVTFTLYIRPECTNPLIVPESINGQKIKRFTDDGKGFILETPPIVGGVIPGFDTIPTSMSIPEPVITDVPGFDTPDLPDTPEETQKSAPERRLGYVMKANGKTFHLSTPTTVDSRVPVVVPWAYMFGRGGGGSPSDNGDGVGGSTTPGSGNSSGTTFRVGDNNW